MKRTTKRLAVTSAAALLVGSGALVSLASSADAATGSWKPYSSSPIAGGWHCARSISPNPGVYGQACLIRASDGATVQAVIIANNRNTTKVAVKAEAWLMVPGTTPYETIYIANCRPSQMAARAYAVCFGPKVKNNNYLLAGGFLNDHQVTTTGRA
jgi:hypothetical protein